MFVGGADRLVTGVELKDFLGCWEGIKQRNMSPVFPRAEVLSLGLVISTIIHGIRHSNMIDLQSYSP